MPPTIHHKLPRSQQAYHMHQHAQTCKKEQRHITGICYVNKMLFIHVNSSSLTHRSTVWVGFSQPVNLTRRRRVWFPPSNLHATDDATQFCCKKAPLPPPMIKPGMPSLLHLPHHKRIIVYTDQTYVNKEPPRRTVQQKLLVHVILRQWNHSRLMQNSLKVCSVEGIDELQEMTLHGMDYLFASALLCLHNTTKMAPPVTQ